MTEYLAHFAPDNLPDIEYSRVNKAQADAVIAAMQLPENQGKFDITFMSVDTPEQRRTAAEEWAGYEQAAGQVEAKRQGAAFVITTRDRSPAYFERLMEDESLGEFGVFVTCAVMKIVIKTSGANTLDLFHAYYGLDKS